MSEKRSGHIHRTTSETDIAIDLCLDGNGRAEILTPVNFLNHMLELFSFHSGFDLTVKASGDTEIDDHHTVEDIGICLGQALLQALGDRTGIQRYGFFLLPMDESLASVALDISGRPLYKYVGPEIKGKTGSFDSELLHEFLRAFSLNAGITLHVIVEYGDNLHHILEAVFKATARALQAACVVNGSRIPSSKGTIG